VSAAKLHEPTVSLVVLAGNTRTARSSWISGCADGECCSAAVITFGPNAVCGAAGRLALSGPRAADCKW
jgi:hypothetical protein